MIGKSADQKQKNLFNPVLTDFIDMGHELVLLAKKLNGDTLRKSSPVFVTISLAAIYLKLR